MPSCELYHIKTPESELRPLVPPMRLFSYCRLLPPRQIAESFCANGWLVGAMGIEFATPQSKSRKRNGVAPPSLFNWSLLVPREPSSPPPADSSESMTKLFRMCVESIRLNPEAGKMPLPTLLAPVTCASDRT
jgi:hypothetical protein